MDYVIRNNAGIYIQLDKDGRPVTCVESCKGKFEYNKALQERRDIRSQIKGLEDK